MNEIDYLDVLARLQAIKDMQVEARPNRLITYGDRFLQYGWCMDYKNLPADLFLFPHQFPKGRKIAAKPGAE